MHSRPNYGIDAPAVMGRFIVFGSIGILAAIFVRPTRFYFLFLPLVSVAVSFLFPGLLMIWGSKVGKFRLRDRILNQLRLKPQEHLLDVGCGHGLLLIGAAKRLASGKAVGIDIWQSEDQAGNSAEATMHNARLEG